MQSTSRPSTGPLAALASSFGITDTTPAQKELCIRPGRLPASSLSYSLAAPTQRPGGLPAFLAEADKHSKPLGDLQVVAKFQKLRWMDFNGARERAALKVKDALCLSLEQNAPHIHSAVRFRVVVALYVGHPVRPMTVGLLRSLRDAEANQFRDFKGYNDFQDQWKLDGKAEKPSTSIASSDPMQESDFLRRDVVAELDDVDSPPILHAPKSGTISSSVEKPSAS